MSQRKDKFVFYIDGQNLCKRAKVDSETYYRRQCKPQAEKELQKIQKNYSQEMLDKQIDKIFKEKGYHLHLIDARRLDLRRLCINLAMEFSKNFEVEIKYYAAIWPLELSAEKYYNDIKYYDSLKEAGIEFREGRISYDTHAFKSSGREVNVKEKGVDVKLAVDLIMDELSGQHDHYIVISQDTDLVPAYEAINGMTKSVHVRTTKKIVRLDTCTTTNKLIPMHLLKRMLKEPEPATEDRIMELKDKFNKRT